MTSNPASESRAGRGLHPPSGPARGRGRRAATSHRPRWDLPSGLGAAFIGDALVGYPVIGLLGGQPRASCRRRAVALRDGDLLLRPPSRGSAAGPEVPAVAAPGVGACRRPCPTWATGVVADTARPRPAWPRRCSSSGGTGPRPGGPWPKGCYPVPQRSRRTRATIHPAGRPEHSCQSLGVPRSRLCPHPSPRRGRPVLTLSQDETRPNSASTLSVVERSRSPASCERHTCC